MFKKVIYTICIAILLLSAGISIFLLLNKDFIKNNLIDALNKQLDAEVAVNGKIDVTFFSTFPHVSLNCQNVIIKDKLRLNDTLAKVQTFGLQLDFWKLVKKQYIINGIFIENGFIHLYTDKNGLSNFNILKESNENNDDTPLNLKRIEIKNIEIDYLDEKVHMHYNLLANSATAKGEFEGQHFVIDLQTDLFVYDALINEAHVLKNNALTGTINIEYNDKTECYEISKNKLNLASNEFILIGSYCSKNNYLDLNAKATGKNLKNVLQLIPKEWFDSQNYKGTGAYVIDALLQGNTNDLRSTVQFTLTNGTLSIIDKNLDLQSVNVKGLYSNKTTKEGSLQLEEFSFVKDESKLNGNLSIDNLQNIEVHSLLYGTLHASLLKQLSDENITITDGLIDLNQLKTIIKINKDNSLKIKEIDGTISITDLSGNIRSLNQAYKVNAHFSGIENYLLVSPVDILIGDNDLHFEGNIKNLLLNILITENEDKLPLEINGNLHSKNFNLNNFITDVNKKENAVSTKEIVFPSIYGKVNVQVDAFTYQKLKIESLQVNAIASGTSYEFDIKQAKTLQGSINGKLFTSIQNQNDFDINLVCNAKQLNISKLFASFNNFNQVELTENNIKGTLTAQLQFHALWKNFSDFDPKSFLMQSTVNIDNGELIDFAPLKSLSAYLDIEQLQHLYFNDLETDIFIKDETIIMPNTQIKSNLISLEAEGKHKFNNDIDYKIKLNLKNLLAAKFKKARTLEEDYTNDVSGGINIYISMTGNLDNPIIKVDKDRIKTKIKDDFKQEKEEFKNLFKKNKESEFQQKETQFEEVEDDNKYIEWEE